MPIRKTFANNPKSADMYVLASDKKYDTRVSGRKR